MAKKEKTFEELTTNWQRILDSAIAKSKMSTASESWDKQRALFWGDIPGMTEKEKQAIAWAHFNYQVENGGISQYLTCNNFGDELPFVLDALFIIAGENPDDWDFIMNLKGNIIMMSEKVFCPFYMPCDPDCKKRFRNYNYDKAVSENWKSSYSEDDDEYYDDFFQPNFTLENGIEFDDYYYSIETKLAIILDKYFSA